MPLQRITWLSVYTIAMAYLESAVVVYLRALYHPDGFTFPIVILPDEMVVIEAGREAATLAMLAAVAVMAGSDRWERFLAFCFCFGLWDIFYYVWLWVLIGWPPSLLTWDILFLMPVPWIGPVLAPMLISLCLIGGSVWLARRKLRGQMLRFPAWQWGLAIAGGALVLLSFMIDSGVVLRGERPPPFRWGLFGAGVALGFTALAAGGRHLDTQQQMKESRG